MQEDILNELKGLGDKVKELGTIDFNINSACKKYRICLSPFGGRLSIDVWHNTRETKKRGKLWSQSFKLVEQQALRAMLDDMLTLGKNAHKTVMLTSGFGKEKTNIGALQYGQDERGNFYLEVQGRSQQKGEEGTPFIATGILRAFTNMATAEGESIGSPVQAVKSLHYWMDTILPVQLSLHTTKWTPPKDGNRGGNSYGNKGGYNNGGQSGGYQASQPAQSASEPAAGGSDNGAGFNF